MASGFIGMIFAKETLVIQSNECFQAKENIFRGWSNVRFWMSDN